MPLIMQAMSTFLFGAAIATITITGSYAFTAPRVITEGKHSSTTSTSTTPSSLQPHPRLPYSTECTVASLSANLGDGDGDDDDAESQNPTGTTTTTTTTTTPPRRTMEELEHVSRNLEQALDARGTEIAKTCMVAVAVTSNINNHNRLGLVATSKIKKGEVVLAMPHDDQFVLSPLLAQKIVFKNSLPEGYDGWTGDTGLVALLILNEVAKCNQKGVPLPTRSASTDAFMKEWVSSLPTISELETQKLHPLLWPEEDQDVLQSSSTNKIYQKLDDIDEDATWLNERIWSKDRATFPESVTLPHTTRPLPCFTSDGFKWAMVLAQSRTVFVDGAIRLLPVMDMCNHNDKANEITRGFMGTFGTTKGAQLVAHKEYAAGEEVFCSYGTKSAADYLLEHGFVPPLSLKTAVSELTFELDDVNDRFKDDKLDILEFETYDLAPMDPIQSFDVVSEPGRDGEPDPAMIQFVRLCKLGGTDSFLLESIFRKEVWEFMSMPVSEPNELEVTNCVIHTIRTALDDLQTQQEVEDQSTVGPGVLCAQLRECETRALTRTMEYLMQEKEALDLKEYYQERRLKDLGLDSEWTPEDESNDVFGATRKPGGASYDW